MKYYICSFIKDSHWYLDEWIQYHLNIGFTDIFLIEDIGSLPHNEITNKYPQVEIHKFEDYFSIIRDFEEGIQRQTRVYQKFLNTHKDGWCAFIDDDEFIELRNINNLDEFIKKYKDDKGVIVPWEMYCANGHIKCCKKIIGSYTKNNIFNGQCRWRFKSFVNLSKEQEIINVHWFKNAISQNGKINNFNTEIYEAYNLIDLDNKMVIRHYFSKSWQDWLWKTTKRGNPTKGLRKINGFFEKNPDMKFAKDLLMKNLVYDSIDFEKLQEEYDELLKEKN